MSLMTIDQYLSCWESYKEMNKKPGGKGRRR